MRIGIFTNNYLPNPYGVTASIEGFRKEFEKLGHQVFIFAPKWKGYQDENPNVFRYPSVDIEIKFRFPLPIPHSRKMDKILSKLDLDIIHSQHPNLLGSAARKWAKKKNIPLVFTWHTLYDQYTNFVPIVPKKLAAKWIIKKAVKFANGADQVIIPTESVRPIIENWGVTNKNIEAVSSGVERDFEDPDRFIIRKKYNFSPDDQIIFVNSRLTSEKNVEFLFEALADVLKTSKKIKILSVGDGYLLPMLKSILNQAGVLEQVVFVGRVEKREIKNFYAAGDIFAYASQSETQGMIINEAMYVGLPVVAVRATGIVDGVIDGETGILISKDKEKFKEAVLQLLNDQDMRQKFSGAAQKIAREKYTSAACAQKMLILYESVIRNYSK